MLLNSASAVMIGDRAASALYLGIHKVWDSAPASLFAGGKQGVWLDESDLSTMFQDLAGTVPAAVNSPVGRRLDKSGRGNHWTAPNNSARPILRLDSGLYSLEWDGVDDAGSTPSIDFTTTDKMSVFYGVEPTIPGVTVFAELSANSAANPGSSYSLTGQDSGTYDNQGARGSAATASNQTAGFAAPLGVSAPYVMAATHDIAGDLSTARRSGIAAPDGTGDKGAGNFGNYPIFIGARNNAAVFFKGHSYGEIVVGKLATSPEIASTEAYLAAKTGVTLP